MRTGIGISPACQPSSHSVLQRSMSCLTSTRGLTLGCTPDILLPPDTPPPRRLSERRGWWIQINLEKWTLDGSIRRAIHE